MVTDINRGQSGLGLQRDVVDDEIQEERRIIKKHDYKCHQNTYPTPLSPRTSCMK